MKIAVLTSQAGSKGTLQDPSGGGFPHAHYVAYTDKPLDLKVWEQRSIHKFSMDKPYADRRHAKLAKVLGWMLVPGYDFYIWHDSTSELQMDPVHLINTYLPPDTHMAAWKHPERDCVYAEAEVIIQRDLDHLDATRAATQFMRSHKYPEHNGLFELSAFIYKNSMEMQQAMLSWWELICKYSSRDQIWFPYVAHMHNLKVHDLPGRAMRYAGNNFIIPQVR